MVSKKKSTKPKNDPKNDFQPCFIKKGEIYEKHPELAPKPANKDTKETKTASKKPTGKKK